MVHSLYVPEAEETPRAHEAVVHSTPKGITADLCAVAATARIRHPVRLRVKGR